MGHETEKSCCGDNRKNFSNGAHASGGAVYAFGLFGALFYYLSNATSFGTVLLGILKSFIWPAMMVYRLFDYLKM